MEVTNQFLAWLAVVLCLGCAVIMQLAIYAIITGEDTKYTIKRLTLWGWIFFIPTVMGSWVGMVFIVSLFQPTLWQLLR